MEMKTDTSRILMSKELEGMLPDFDELRDEEPTTDPPAPIFLHAYLKTNDKSFTGVMHSVTFDVKNPEITFACVLEEAFELSKMIGERCNGFSVIRLEDESVLAKVDDDFVVETVFIRDVSFDSPQMCEMTVRLFKFS